MPDEADRAQEREEAREASKKKRKTTSIELPGEAEVAFEDEEKVEESKVSEAKKEEPKPAEAAPAGASEVVKPKTAKTTVCKVCGKTVKAQGIGAHMRRNHKELMNLKKDEGEAEEESGEKPKEGGSPLTLEALLDNPVVLAVIAGVVLLGGLVVVMLLQKPKEPDSHTEDYATAEPLPANNNIPVTQEERIEMQEQEGRIVEESMPDGTTRRFQVVKSSDGSYGLNPLN